MKILVMIMAGLASMLVTAEPGQLEIQQRDEGFLVTEGGSKVLFYQRKPKSMNGEFERANYVHPLYGLDGEELTEDFPKDHLHHRGIFWAWHQVSIGGKKLGDAWAVKDFSWNVVEVKPLVGDSNSVTLKTVVLWQSPQWVDAAGRQKPLVKEATTIRVHRAAEGHRKIDFTISLLAMEDDVRIGGSEDEKGYGGFSPRIRLTEDIKITGQGGAVKPEVNAVAAGPWVDFSGSLGKSGQKSGVAILTHPSLPVFPPPWILRDSRSMQNPVYPGRNPVLLSRTKPMVLRYRLVVHRGDAQLAQIGRLQKEYEKEP